MNDEPDLLRDVLDALFVAEWEARLRLEYHPDNTTKETTTMATTKKGGATATPAPTFVTVLDGFSGPAGVFTRGQRVPADAQVVTEFPQFFISEDAAPDELAAKRSLLYEPSFRIAEETQKADQARYAIPVVRARQAVTIDCAGSGIEGLPTWGSINIPEGERFPATHALVRARPELFEAVDL